jgi:UDP-GlcNAc:undecaprenyl-phosphate GlcNAc-1-phosphate transferase
MPIYLASIVTSFLISFLIIPVIVKYSHQRNIVDVPGGRKIHKKVTPSMGGIAIFLGFFLSSIIWINSSLWQDIKFLLVPFMIIFFTGLRDDLIPLKPLVKLAGQVTAAAFLLYFLDLRLHSFYGLFGLEEWPIWISYIVTVFTIIVITNAFNLVDGLDGLAGSIASAILLFYGIWYYSMGDSIFSVFCFSMLGAIIAFLLFNWEPSEIFMGDTGALVIGMMLAVVTIRFINLNFGLTNNSPVRFDSTISTAACLIIVPLLDTTRIIILRLSKRQSPFKPDKSHIHHAIMRLGFSHSKTTFTLVSIQIFFILLALVFKNIGDKILLPIVIVLAIIFSITLDRMIINKKKASKSYDAK